MLNGPLANGPIINGVPVGSGTADVNTPSRESHVLNDAILQAALDLRKRDRTRRKVIFVISNGHEMGSKASYRDVLRVLLSNEIQVEAVSVGSSALPVYDKIERLHVPLQGYGDILPRYASATGGSEYRELTRSAIESMYAQVMSEARNQYTLGYSPGTTQGADVETLPQYRSNRGSAGTKSVCQGRLLSRPGAARNNRAVGVPRLNADCSLNQRSTNPPSATPVPGGGHLSNLRRTFRV